MKNKDLIKFYNKVYKKGENKHYTKLRTKQGLLPNEETAVLESVTWKGKTVLDVGCGTGLLCAEISRRGAKKVVGLDFSQDAILKAKELHSAPNLDFTCGDIKKHKTKYDLIVSLGTLEHMDNPFFVLKKIKKLLKPNGKIIISCPNWTNPRGHILQTLFYLFNAPITLADLHYLTPIHFENWAKKLGMKLDWKTIDKDWAHGERLLVDFKRRLPNVLRDANLPNNQKNIDKFIKWIKDYILPINYEAKFSGATGIYVFK